MIYTAIFNALPHKKNIPQFDFQIRSLTDNFECNEKDILALLNVDITEVPEKINYVTKKYCHLQHFIIPVESEKLSTIKIWADILYQVLQRFPKITVHLLLPTLAIEFWRYLSKQLNYHENISVFLYLNDNEIKLSRQRCPSTKKLISGLKSEKVFDTSIYNDWVNEPVSSIVIPAKIFYQPVIESQIQQLLTDSFFAPSKIRSIPLISIIPQPGIDLPLPQIQNLKHTLSNIISSHQIFNCCIRDPLQPLRDDLSLQIYEIFEKDSNKYNAYGKALKQAILDISSEKIIKILVIGPGRGPLVDIILAISCPSEIEVTIVEKNGKCIELLNHKNAQNWHNRVKIINQDIRSFKNKQPYDIIVSELLGSFGCNELYPDIWVQCNPQLLHHSTIVIPSNVCNYLQPIYSPVLRQMINRNSVLRPYVADLNQGSYLKLSEFQKFGTFDFNYKNLNMNLIINKVLKFSTIKNKSAPLHGFLGVFKATLYKEHIIGIHDDQKNTDQFCSSWSPIFFPIEQVIFIEDQISVEFCRNTSKSNVWYSYVVNGKFHNANGESYKIDNS